MKEIVLHIPHDGHFIPEELKEFLLVNEKLLKEYDKQMSDRFVFELVKDFHYEIVRFKISRLMCDVERFLSNEIMETYGMGFCYEKFFDDMIFKKITNKTKQLTKQYYTQHHKKLDNIAKNLKNKEWLLLDLHSFNISATRKELILKNKEIPDICIGFEENYCDKKIIKLAKNIFENYGYKVVFNYPYSGSFVPNIIYSGKLKSKINSLMVEINSQYYLDENRNLSTKHLQLKSAIKTLCEKYQNLDNN